MSAIPYAAPIVNGTFVTAVGTGAELVAGIETKLSSAGWSTISGGGTGDVLMKTQVTPAPKSNSIRLRLFDAGGATAQLFIKSDSGLLQSQAHSLTAAAGKTFRVIACPFNGSVMVDGSVANGDYALFGTLYIPTFLEGVLTADLGIISSNNSSLRTQTRSEYSSHIANGALNNFNGFGTQNLCFSYLTDALGVSTQHRWHDDSIPTSEVVISFGLVADVRKRKGLLHNAMLVSGQYALDDVSIVNYDGHGWRVISAYGANDIALALAIS